MYLKMSAPFMHYESYQTLIEMLFERDGRHCAYCSVEMTDPWLREENRATIDHVIPRSKGGTNAMDNFVLACRSCNMKKANKNPSDFMKEIWGENLERCPHRLGR